MAEFDAVGVATVFAADAELNVGPGALAFLDGDLHKLADAGLVNGSERILLTDLLLLVGPEEGAGIGTTHAEAGLGQVVGAEAEEFGGVRDFVSGQRAAGNLDH